jgi:hypothetical protein
VLEYLRDSDAVGGVLDEHLRDEIFGIVRDVLPSHAHHRYISSLHHMLRISGIERI